MERFAPSSVLPTECSWRKAKTPLSGLSLEEIRSFKITPDTIESLILKLRKLRCRFLIEMIPQIIRARNRPNSNGKAIMILGMCRKGDVEHGNFEQPSCITEKILSALEYPGRPSVVLFDLRQDCIRFMDTRKPEFGGPREHCLKINTMAEFNRCLELVIHEINMATNVFKLEFESVLSFSSA